MMTSLLRIENANVLIGRAEALLFVGLRNPGFCPSKQREIGESIRGHEDFSSGECYAGVGV